MIQSQTAPPAYDFTDGRPISDSKFEKQAQVELAQTRSNESTVLGEGRSLESGGPPLSFHVYSSKKWKDRDDIVLGADKVTCEYYLTFPIKWSGKWDLKLSKGGKDGPEIATLKKGALGCLSKVSISMADGHHTDLTKKSVLGRTFYFTSAKGTKYKWKPKSMWSCDYVCYFSGTDDVVATWRSTLNAVNKDGQLLISQHYAKEEALIMATVLAVEEHAREERQTATLAAIS
ncbi:hypothetical protein T439DRAFT_330451 [Meredithblackwellia eburnea MCA 4105]